MTGDDSANSGHVDSGNLLLAPRAPLYSVKMDYVSKKLVTVVTECVMNLREIISLKQIWDKSSATVSWRKRITHTSVLMLWYARLVTTIPPYVILSGFTDGNLTLKGVEIATSIWRGERNLYTQCYAQEPQFYRESWYWNIHNKFSRQAFDIIWTCVSWYMLYFEMYFRLFLEWCYGFMIMYLWYLNIQVPKHFGLQLPSVRNAKRP